MSEEKPTESTEVTIRNEVTAGGQVLALVPQTVDQAWRLAKALAISGLAPPSMATAEKCLVAIMAGAEVGLPPFQAVQSFAVINNRPVLWGDGALAVVRAQGFKVREWAVAAETEEEVAYCEVIRPDTREVIERRFSVQNAKTAKLWGKKGANGQDTPWITYPSRMLQMRARSWALRDGAADAMRGFQVREEVEDFDMKDVTPVRATSGLRARLEANKKAGEQGFNVERAAEGIIEPIAKTERPEVTSDEDAARIDAEPFVPTIDCEACGAPAGTECAPDCPSWAEVEPETPPAPAEPELRQTLAVALDLQVQIDAYIKAMDEATSVTKLKTARARAHQLLAKLSETAPERADALDNYFNRRYSELDAANPS